MTELALQLKSDGNKLYAEKDFKGARAKYTEAIAEDGANAVLYANRAACNIGLKNYTEAAHDSRKATEIDPGYAKAWARLATCLDMLTISDEVTAESVTAWQKALDALPKENLSPAEVKQKEQYQSGLQAASKPRLMRVSAFDLPWDMAKAMMPELLANKVELSGSSAWVVLKAYQEFMQGVEAMDQLKDVQTPQGMATIGRLDGTAGLTNGIMRDYRVFHMTSPDFMTKYTDQINFEATKRKAWTKAGPDVIIAEAQERLRKKGWDDVRPALSVTVRGLMMRAFFETGARNTASAVDYYGRALKVLDWGREAWKDVPKEDCGVIFQPSFIRGVRTLRIETLMQAYATDPGPNAKHSLEDLLQEADYILHDLEANPLRISPGEAVDPGFIPSFTTYPKAQALCMKGFYHARRAEGDLDDQSAFDHFRKSAEFYIEAANTLPEDDENHAYYLLCGVDNLVLCETPLKVTLPIFERIRLAIPKMIRIWKNSPKSKPRDQALGQAMEKEQALLKKIESGECTLDDSS